MSSTSVKILESAAEIVGSNEALAERLEISMYALALYMEGRRLPDPLLLKTVDIILEDRQSRLNFPAGQALRRGPQALEN